MVKQKAAIVTGASQGIGAGAVEVFLKRGYSVVANSRNISNASPFPASPHLAPVGGDIGDPNTAAKILDTAVSKFGRVDVLVNNAGLYFSKHFTDYTHDDLRSLISIFSSLPSLRSSRCWRRTTAEASSTSRQRR